MRDTSACVERNPRETAARGREALERGPAYGSRRIRAERRDTKLTYVEEVECFYQRLAEDPRAGLCCVGSEKRTLPGLHVPEAMERMSYGCGSSVHPGDLNGSPTVVYVGVGGGKEALQFAYFSRKRGGVIAVEPVRAMREAARKNLLAAAGDNSWFDPEYVDLREGDAFRLPVADHSVDLVAQNCLFNVFKPPELARALTEARRVLVEGGRLSMSDPIADEPMPSHLRDDDRLRAMCLSGALPLEDYLDLIVAAGFGQLEVRRRRPYRVLDPPTYALERPLLIESVDLVAVAVPVAPDGPCIFTGRTATYVGPGARFNDEHGHVLERGVPADVCDRTAAALARDPAIVVTPPTWHYGGGGSC